MNHYETLGVSPDAKPSDIKRAYRSRARAVHPDKGGKAEEFAAVAHAFEVLSDPERRLLYDTTGADSQLPIEKEVQNVMMGLFNQALASENDIEVTAFVREGLNQTGERIKARRQELKARQKHLKAKRKTIGSTGTNLVHLVIDGELRGIDGQLAELAHKTEIAKACLKALDEYSEDFTPQIEVVQTIYFNGFKIGL